MDYTLSPQHVVHPVAGFRMHDQNLPIPTQVSDKDLNSVIWSLMEVVKAAGLSGIQFDPSNSATYTRLLAALNSLFVSPSELTAALPNSLALARAWVTFNGSTGAILQSYNVSSVTRNAAGTYTLSFPAGTFTSTEYVPLGSIGTSNAATGLAGDDNYVCFGNFNNAGVKTTTALRAYSMNKDTQSFEDSTRVFVAVFGG